MSHLPNVLTVQQVLDSRRGCAGLMYRGCQLRYLDWHPAPDGKHYAVIIQPNNEPVEIWLAPETWLEEQFALLVKAKTGTSPRYHSSK